LIPTLLTTATTLTVTTLLILLLFSGHFDDFLGHA
jgi:hypothetical protein